MEEPGTSNCEDRPRRAKRRRMYRYHVRKSAEDCTNELSTSIANVVEQHYNTVMNRHGQYSRYKVLSAIIMTRPETAHPIVLSFATGTKCISGEYLSFDGTAVNDCHAEIVARRGFKLFLIEQLKLLSCPASTRSIFLRKKDDNGHYILKQDINFHLFISTASCGDARIFTQNIPEYKKYRNISRRKAVALLRTKMETGEGSIPANYIDSVQTWDSLILGTRLMTMSCSDKILKWNVIGIQGSQLCKFIEPIYLQSIVIGDLFDYLHLERALYNRIDPIPELKNPFRINKPELLSFSCLSKLPDIGRSPAYCVNWIINEHDIEVLDPYKGRPTREEEQVSRLCKAKFAKHFFDLLKTLGFKSYIKELNNKTYAEIKYEQRDYFIAKETFYHACEKRGLGRWIKKPIEQDSFIPRNNRIS